MQRLSLLRGELAAVAVSVIAVKPLIYPATRKAEIILLYVAPLQQGYNVLQFLSCFVHSGDIFNSPLVGEGRFVTWVLRLLP